MGKTIIDTNEKNEKAKLVMVEILQDLIDQIQTSKIYSMEVSTEVVTRHSFNNNSYLEVVPTGEVRLVITYFRAGQYE
jgi:hypothetical protein